MIIADIDSKGVNIKLKALERAITKKGLSKEELDIGFEILRLSQKEVPHDVGTLQNSGTVEEVNGDVVIGYHEPYAAKLHEHPEYHFQKGRKGKYLEDPVRKNQDVLGKKFSIQVGDKIRDIL